MRIFASPGIAGVLAGTAAVAAALAVSGLRNAPAPWPHHHPVPSATATPQTPHAAAASEDATANPADELIAGTRRHLEQWKDVADAERDGFRSIGDAITGYEHFVQWDWARDERVLDPRRPESLVYRVRGAGRRLVSAMYILPPGKTMRDVPDLGDERAQWHRHDDLCWRGGRVVGLHRGGRCIPEGKLRVTPPMLHVWVERHPCGPFAGLDGARTGAECDAHQEHEHGS